MNPEAPDKTLLINLYLTKAEKSYKDALWLVETHHEDIAAGRFYYACFYAIQALFLNDGKVSKSHKGLQTIFLKDYVREGKVDAELGAWLSRMERLRELADYNCAYNISAEEVMQMQKPAADIISIVKILIGNS